MQSRLRMAFKDTFFSHNQIIACRGELMDFSVPRVMGILNVTPDSFYDGGRYLQEGRIISRVAEMINQGADIIDVGACSSRPGAVEIGPGEEESRLRYALEIIRREFPEACISVDTYRAAIAKMAVQEYGANMINDISAGRFDERMLAIVGAMRVPYIMMHMQGSPKTMQKNPVYDDLIREVVHFFSERTDLARQNGITDLILDPGFGFGKTREHNFMLLHSLRVFTMLGMPILAGMSRKSMIYGSIRVKPEEALNGTTVVNTMALMNGASILRVHDIKEAIETVRLFLNYRLGGEETVEIDYI
jgi:dihydropteroate synthase